MAMGCSEPSHSPPGVSDRPVFSPGPAGLPPALRVAWVSVAAPGPQALQAFRVARQRAGCPGSVSAVSCCLFLSLVRIGLFVSSFVSVCCSLSLSVHRALPRDPPFLSLPGFPSLSLPLFLPECVLGSASLSVPCMSLSPQPSHCLFSSRYLQFHEPLRHSMA